ncbi:TorF family putative porin [uncultured Hyphomicrobium sp.]|jgi:uncharacterized protein (TIGR02001 family)|uniref:TorF family putative porin n=1 Tax=uncultured Hyphomicrobium sp. TaxID=194373 RepID=UPI0025DB4A43|nr:TorF family putative porin [uncultured Hyphomicrobium sp.]
MLGLQRTARTIAAGAAALFCLTAPVLAEDREFSWSVTGTGTSDYIFRGISLSDERPVFQASVDGSYGILYFGAWGSILNEQAGDPVEIDFYTGIKPVLGPVTFDFGVVYYTYFWADEPSDLDYYELKAGFTYEPVKNLTVKPFFWWVPDQANAPQQWAIEGTVAYALPQVGIFTPTVSGLVGYQDADTNNGFYFGDDSYTYWNAGLALGVEKFTFDFRYWDTTLDTGLADERFVFTASITLP